MARVRERAARGEIPVGWFAFLLWFAGAQAAPQYTTERGLGGQEGERARKTKAREGERGERVRGRGRQRRGGGGLVSPSTVGTDTHAYTGTGQAFGKCLMDDNAVSRQALTTERITSKAAVKWDCYTAWSPRVSLPVRLSQPSETRSSSSPLLHTQTDRPTDRPTGYI